MFDCDVRYSKFEVVSRPVFELRLLLGSLLRYVEVCEEDQGGVARNEDENVPDAVHVGEVDGEPRVAEHSVQYPTEHGQQAHSNAPQSEPMHSGTLDSVE